MMWKSSRCVVGDVFYAGKCLGFSQLPVRPCCLANRMRPDASPVEEQYLIQETGANDIDSDIGNTSPLVGANLFKSWIDRPSNAGAMSHPENLPSAFA